MMFNQMARGLFAFSITVFAAAQQTSAPAQASAVQSQQEDATIAETTPVVTHHQITVNGKTIKYTATAGRLVLKPERGPAEAAIFFTAYTLDEEQSRTRPVTFVFNGGPGTATAWLHLGALGPKKIRLEKDGQVPPPPYVTVDNPETILDHTDLVFIDAPGTGYSRVRADLTNSITACPAMPMLSIVSSGFTSLDINAGVRRYFSLVKATVQHAPPRWRTT